MQRTEGGDIGLSPVVVGGSVEGIRDTQPNVMDLTCDLSQGERNNARGGGVNVSHWDVVNRVRVGEESMVNA